MFELIRTIAITIVAVLQPKNGTCPDGTLQGWCNNCYTGASNCGQDGKRCCD